MTIIDQARGFADRTQMREAAKGAYYALTRTRLAVARAVPAMIRPRPRQLTMAITADCNLRCQGCRYGRDFMTGSRLPLSTVKAVLDDAHDAGIGRVRFYGGEPLLHPDLPAMVAHAHDLGLDSYVTTNGTHLGARIGALYAAGLRLATIGFYGLGDAYTAYTQRRGHFERLERSLATVRETCGSDMALQLNFVVMRDTCRRDALEDAWNFALKYDMYFHLDLAGMTIPFFDTGPEDTVALRPSARPAAEALARDMIALKRAHPDRFLHSEAFIRSVPDWLIKGADMRVPCDAYEMLWIGADGSLQLCDTALPLGNVLTQRLRDIVFSDAHRRAARDGFQLKCPNCTCRAETRIRKDATSWRKYGRPLPGEAGRHGAGGGQ